MLICSENTFESTYQATRTRWEREGFENFERTPSFEIVLRLIVRLYARLDALTAQVESNLRLISQGLPERVAVETRDPELPSGKKEKLRGKAAK